MDALRFIWLLFAVAFAMVVGAGLGAGKTVLLSWGGFPRVVTRRKDPADFWLATASFSAFAAMFVYGACRN